MTVPPLDFYSQFIPWKNMLGAVSHFFLDNIFYYQAFLADSVGDESYFSPALIFPNPSSSIIISIYRHRIPRLD